MNWLDLDGVWDMGYGGWGMGYEVWERVHWLYFGEEVKKMRVPTPQVRSVQLLEFLSISGILCPVYAQAVFEPKPLLYGSDQLVPAHRIVM